MAASGENPRPVTGATRARQGMFGQHVFWVLVFGTLLAGLGLFAAWLWQSDELASTERGLREEAAAAQKFETGPPQTDPRGPPAPP